jgi:hypothetical protein
LFVSMDGGDNWEPHTFNYEADYPGVAAITQADNGDIYIAGGEAFGFSYIGVNNPHPTVRALRAELLRDLDRRPPALIVLFEEGWPAGGYERFDTFPALTGRLEEYDLVQAGPGYRIHAQRHR